MLIVSLLVIFHLCFGVLWDVSPDEGGSQFSLMGLLYINPWVRIFEFYIGVLVCKIYMKTCNTNAVAKISNSFFSFAELTVVVFALFTMWLSPRFVGLLGLGNQAGTVLSYYLSKSGSVFSFAFVILIFAYGKGLLHKFLSQKLFILLGEISFALYLVHMSVLVWFQKNLTVFSGYSTTKQAVIFWGISLLTAWFLHRLIELPCRKLIVDWYKTRTFSYSVFSNSLFFNALFVIVLFSFMKVLAPL